MTLYNTQPCLLVMIEKWKEVFDKGGLDGELLTHPFKVFCCIKPDLLIANLLRKDLIHIYYVLFSVIIMRENEEQKYNSYSPYTRVASGVSQGSQGLILSSLLFNINICHMFFEKTNAILPATTHILWFRFIHCLKQSKKLYR